MQFDYHLKKITLMKTKILLLTLLVSLGSVFTANAQLTTGVSSSKVIRTGNRAQAGDFGLYVGATTTAIGNDANVNILPLLNLKYMKTDKLEMRVGLEINKTKEKLYGDVDASTNDSKYSTSAVMVYPGIAHHFSNLNILDVYVGAELPLGWDASTSTSVVDNYTQRTTKRAFVLGLGAFVGLQAYIADLPLAIGLEYGISSRLDLGLKYKNERTSNNTTTITYSPTNDFRSLSTSQEYDNLKARKGAIGNQIRVTLSYYFK